MDRVIQIKNEKQQLEARLVQLKRELDMIQTNCDHEFKNSKYAQQCTKCHLSQSLNW